MFNPTAEQHAEDCRCETAEHPGNQEPPVDEIEMTTNAYGERLRQSGERIRLAQDWGRDLWAKGFRGRCLWLNILTMFEPPSWSPEYNLWREVRNSIP